MFCVGKTGSRFFGGGPPAKWVIHGGPHRGTRPKGSKILRFSFNKLDPMCSDTFYKKHIGDTSKSSILSKHWMQRYVVDCRVKL